MILSVFYEHMVEAAEQTGKSISEICHLVFAYGITEVEIDMSRLMQEEKEILSQLSVAGIGISCIYGFFDFGNHPEPEKGMELLELAKRTGSNKVMIIPGFVKPDERIEPALHNMKQIMIKICQSAKEMGITVCMEDFDNVAAPFATSSQLLWFMDQVPGVTCAFDTGNFLYSEEDAKEAFIKLEPYIVHVHCKDRSLVEKEGEEPKLTIKGRRLYSSAVGYGCIPMEEIVTELLKKGYDKTFAIEHFGSQNQLEDMRLSVEWLQNLKKQIEEDGLR